ncbi:AraC family transcriptional regulator [Pseudoclavibacter chungangensis]|uniref:AraC family transcriptional regulator n=1 Tax=Pseudoclavibacter chungangensis TaxID=587635 RepID=A0A7J5BNA9_9MICO|nr:AraC family transcriptional regulator [Pseudoclavibacter chungangensis]KAB1652851.1 AraC family transcriptional regulator [Pseudoclavibacter chungangensis]NYJ67153.1 AraC-like DNA-binding protein [Pseudoclavibacter chungangensis]
MSMMLDTRMVSVADRPEYWSAGIAEHFFPMRVKSFGAPSFDAQLGGGGVGPLLIRSITGPPHRVERTQRMVASADPECFLLYLVRRGACRVEQDDRGCELRAGDVAIQDTSRPSSFEATLGIDVQVVTFPKWFLGGHAAAIGARAATRVVGAETPLVRMVAPLFASIARAADGGGVSGGDGEIAAELLSSIMRGLYVERVADRSSPLQARMRQYALAHLRDPDLGPERIARAHHVSTRYVHKLFAASGGVSAWIRDQRLEEAARELRETDHSVSQVAFSWGYGNAASFARAFRRAHGRSPRELRIAG